MNDPSTKKAKESPSGTDVPTEEAQEETLARVRLALKETEGFGDGRIDLIVAAIQAKGVRFVSE